MNVFVAGGHGFIGTNLVKYLTDHTDHSVVVFDNFCMVSQMNIPVFRHKRVKVIQGDIQNSMMVKHWMKDCDVVINLAAQCGVQQSITDPVSDAHTNVVGLVNLLQWAHTYKISRFIHASSFAVHNTRSFYAVNKKMGEQYLQLFSELYAMETVALRLSNVYGPYSEHKSSVIAKWMRLRDKGEVLPVFGDGSQVRDFVFVGDVVEAFVHAIDVDLPKNHMVLPVCTGVGTAVKEVAQLISSEIVCGHELPVGDGDAVVVDPLVTRSVLQIGLDTNIMDGLNMMKTTKVSV